MGLRPRGEQAEEILGLCRQKPMERVLPGHRFSSTITPAGGPTNHHRARLEYFETLAYRSATPPSAPRMLGAIHPKARVSGLERCAQSPFNDLSANEIEEQELAAGRVQVSWG